MKRLGAFLGSALIAGVTAAHAGQATGLVKAIDQSAHTVTLNDDRVFTFDAKAKLSALGIGYHVSITYTTADDVTNNATAFNVLGITEGMVPVPAPSPPP